jgi:hypothetical protein
MIRVGRSIKGRGWIPLLCWFGLGALSPVVLAGPAVSPVQQLVQEQKEELRVFKSDLKRRKVDWEVEERKKRHAFFSEEKSGPKRRSYIQDFLRRRTAFKAALAQDLQAKLQEQDLKLKLLESQQSIPSQPVGP